MQQLHICHVVLSLEPGGLENGVVNVVNGLDPSAFCSSICCLQRQGEFASRIRPEVQIRSIEMQPGINVRAILRLVALFREWRVDIVHTRNEKAFLYGVIAAKLAGTSVVIHSEHGRTFPGRPLPDMMQRLLLPAVDVAFAVSEKLRSDLGAALRLRQNRFEVVYNGVDVAQFSRDNTRYADHDQARPLSIGSVGRLAAVKNYALLLKAFSLLPRDRVTRLILVGDGPDREMLSNLAVKLEIADFVDFKGHRNDINTLLQTMDVFVLPSLSEGMSNTLLEAMAAGIPVVASDVGGNSEIVEDGRSGLLFRSGDIQHAVDQILRLAESADLRRKLAQEGAMRVGRNFSIRAMINRYEQLYRRAWERKHGAPVC